MNLRATRYAICDQTTKDLGKAVEGKPDAGASALFLLRIPLTGEKSKAGSYCGFEDTEEETDGNCTSEIVDCCEAGELGEIS